MSRIEEALRKASQQRGKSKHRIETAKSDDHVSPNIPPSVVPEKMIPKDVIERVSGQHMLVSMNDICSPAAEEFRKLKQHLVRITKKESFKNTILVTSGTVGEGKSVTSTNLAISLAQEFDHTVLLIDADLRRPSCNELLCLENKFGLSDCLMQGKDISEAIIRTGIGKLSFLPAGTPMANPGELLASKRMAKVVREVKERYSDRYIIIDSPPVLPFAETRTLGRLVDMTLLVVKEGRLSKYELNETLEALGGSHIAGAVFTQATQASTSSRYSGYSRYNYNYYYSSY